jgi:hypothetical protein
MTSQKKQKWRRSRRNNNNNKAISIAPDLLNGALGARKRQRSRRKEGEEEDWRSFPIFQDIFCRSCTGTGVSWNFASSWLRRSLPIQRDRGIKR